MQTRRQFLRSFAAGVGAAALHPALSRAQQIGATRRPNIVFFLVDDMGWMDTPVYGSEYYETPNMVRLANRSVVFTNAYTASPLCSPTRASIMSGQYPARTGLTNASGHRPPRPQGASVYPAKVPPNAPVILPESRNVLSPGVTTLAEALRSAGYRTGHFGKWHLGLNPEHWPEAQGFEVSFHGAPDPGPPSYFSPYGFKAGTVTDGPEGEYIADRLTQEAIRFMEAHRNEPFFLNLWHYNVHGPWGHKEQITRRFVGRKDPRGKQGNPIMASMLASVDESLGHILDSLRDLGIEDNTIVVFFSDNGGNVHSNTPDDPRMSRIREGHPRWPMVQDWRTYAGDQPPTNNSPLRRGKGWLYEGGVRVPMMVRWPGTTRDGSRCSDVVCSVDFFPTLLEATDVPRPPAQPVDGVSLVPLLRNRDVLDREAVFFYYPHGGPAKPPGIAVRSGDWKLIHWYWPSDAFPEENELYNLRQDIGETRNLAAEHPEKVRQLQALIEEHLKTTGANAPKPNPGYVAPPKAAQGWRAMNDGISLAATEHGIAVSCTERRPSLVTNRVPPVKGDFVFRASIRSTGTARARLYWGTKTRPQAVPEYHVQVGYPDDGKWHEVSIPFTATEDLVMLRFDTGMKPGRVELQWARLEKDDGQALCVWEFAPPE